MNTINLTEDKVSKLKEVQALLNELFAIEQGTLFATPEQVRPVDVFLGLKQVTREFFKAMYNAFGFAVIDRKDAVLENLVRAHYVDLSVVVKSGEARGILDVKWNGEGKQRRIDCFQFKIKPE